MSEGGSGDGSVDKGMREAGASSGAGQPASDVLDRIFAVIESRRQGNPDTSHTARLFHKGTRKIAQKVGEEAVEVVIEAIRRRRDRLIEESADLMYHLMVMWADAKLTPADVWAELSRREGISGLAREAAREQTLGNDDR
jgi:phosphoribosyl-ATP pyrophosphohydrolase